MEMYLIVELLEMKTKVLEIFNVQTVEELTNALMRCVNDNDTEKMQSFEQLVNGDLSKDWLQIIYQYYLADRKEKKQDFTPKCLATFLNLLVGEADTIVDMCAGSGALTIQRWNMNQEQRFLLFEIDETVIPYLLFNLAVRNISAVVKQGDVLQSETVRQWRVVKGVKYGYVSCIEPSL